MTVAHTEDPRQRANDEAPVAARPAAGRRTGRLKGIAMLSRQLAVLIRTGTPLADALGAIDRQLAAGPWKSVVSDLHTQLEQGSSLSDAMDRHPEWFDPVSLSLVSAGESSGNLDDLLERLSLLCRQQLKIRRTVTSAMLYPALLLTVGVAVVGVMVGLVLPRFADLFASLNAPLPPSTQVLMSLSDLLRGYWWALLGLIAAAAVGARLLLATPTGRRSVDAVMVRAPYLGGLTRNLVTARIARLLGVLLNSRVPMLETLQLIRYSSGNSLYADLMQQAEEAVVRGETLSSVLAASPLINPYVAEAMRHGERSGQMSPVLLDMAEFMDEENEVVVRTAARLMEPIMLILLGGVVAVIALSIFMPLFDLTALTQGGH